MYRISPDRSIIDPELPGCGACLSICSVCKKIEQRCKYNLLTDEEALSILGCSKGTLSAYIRSGRIKTDRYNTKWRLHRPDVARIKQQLVARSIDRTAQHTGIVNSIDRLAAIYQAAIPVIDMWLVEFSVGGATAQFRYGHAVDLPEPPARLWYVYHLCYPKGRPFYVGKGIGPRMYQHAQEAKRGEKSYKCNIIRRMWDKGEQIKYRVVFVTPDEQEAYDYEVLEIARIGRHKLTNMTIGGASGEEFGRVFGLNIPIGQMSYAQFSRLLLPYRKDMPQAKIDHAYANWADARRRALLSLRDLASSVHYDNAVRLIDAEIEPLQLLGGRQMSLIELEDRKERRYSEWKYC